MKLLLFACSILLIVYAAQVSTLPHHGHEHPHTDSHEHSNHSNHLNATHEHASHSSPESNSTATPSTVIQVLTTATTAAKNMTEKNCTEHQHNHDSHLNHTDHLEHKKDQAHELGGNHTSGHSHHHHSSSDSHIHTNETVSHEHHLNLCHKDPVLIDCTDNIKGKFIFKHMNATHHQCSLIENNKCSSSENAFESLESCEKQCHHDKHR